MALSLANILRPSVQGKVRQLEQVIMRSQDIAKALASGKDVSSWNTNVDHPLVASLLKIHNQLRTKEEEDAKGWIVQCVLQFTDIFNMTVTVEERYHLIINTLIKQLKINYGVLYVISDDNNFIEAKAAYGLDKRSYPRFDVGEGLVGQCFNDREPMEFKTPNNFIRISSGLGESSPTNIILTPLIFFNNVVGVVEVASFTAFNETHKELLSRVAQSIAGFIINVKNVEQTNQLLSKIEALNKLTENKLKQQEEIHQKVVSRLKEKLNQTKLTIHNSLNTINNYDKETN